MSHETPQRPAATHRGGKRAQSVGRSRQKGFVAHPEVGGEGRGRPTGRDSDEADLHPDFISVSSGLLFPLSFPTEGDLMSLPVQI